MLCACMIAGTRRAGDGRWGEGGARHYARSIAHPSRVIEKSVIDPLYTTHYDMALFLSLISCMGHKAMGTTAPVHSQIRHPPTDIQSQDHFRGAIVFFQLLLHLHISLKHTSCQNHRTSLTVQVKSIVYVRIICHRFPMTMILDSANYFPSPRHPLLCRNPLSDWRCEILRLAPWGIR